MNKAILGIRDLRGQLLALEKRVGAADSAKSITSTSGDLRKEITSVEEELIQINAKSSEDEANYPTRLNSKLAYLFNVVDSADAGPTAADLGVFSDLDQRLEAQLVKWREIMAKDVPALNDSTQKKNIPLVGVPAR